MKRPVTLIIAAGLVILLVFISAVWPMVSGNRFSDQFRNLNNNPQPGQVNPESGNLRQGTPPAFPGNGDQKRNENGTGSTPGASTLNSEMPGQGFLSLPGNQNLTIAYEYILYVVILILGLIAFGGLWLGRRWGNVVSIIVSAFVVVTTLPALFQTETAINFVQLFLKISLAVGTVVLVLLPVSKMETSPIEN
jgi:hypothetical protein